MPADDVLVVTKLDRLARSLRDATDIADELAKKGVSLNLRGSVYDPTDPVGRVLFNVLGIVAEFEADLIRARTREGMAIAKVVGKLRGGKPKLIPSQEKHLVQLHRTGAYTTRNIPRASGRTAKPGSRHGPELMPSERIASLWSRSPWNMRARWWSL